MKRIDQQEIENENKNETGAVLPQGPPQENPSWENDPNTKLTYKTSYNLIRGVAEPILRHLILGFLLLRAQVARRKSSGSHNSPAERRPPTGRGWNRQRKYSS